ncbi:2TM domain-containing protein [Flavobacterium amnicola]|uniref:2TM domain-containing protein n=1 Tax=Flavobacterium amnicola TaxID=2506422 RepID=A0A4Q1K2D5_9FLAO|nr:2TM domain-containing protein [Flavobacterium amnicola]RXR19095.1 2TM domain-containing protein [Flavobacterium amnicola]
MNPHEEIKYQEAARKVKKMRAFYSHLFVYILFNTFIIAIKTQRIDEGETIWHAFKVPFCWGIGLVLHALRAFDKIPFLGNDWEQRKINEILEKENPNNTRK